MSTSGELLTCLQNLCIQTSTHVRVKTTHGETCSPEVTQPMPLVCGLGAFLSGSHLLETLWKHCLLCPPGRIRTRRQSSGSATNVASTPSDSRGRSRAKVVSQSQRKKCILCCLLSQLYPTSAVGNLYYFYRLQRKNTFW